MVWIRVPDIVDDCASYLDMFVAAPESDMQQRRRMCCLERRENERKVAELRGLTYGMALAFPNLLFPLDVSRTYDHDRFLR